MNFAQRTTRVILLVVIVLCVLFIAVISTTDTFTTPGTAPVASFTADVTSGKSPLNVEFRDTSLNKPTGWIWSYSNAAGNRSWVAFSASRNPVQTFGAGNFSIRLNASNSQGYDISDQITFINISSSAGDSHGMTYFPPDHVWNVPVDDLPVQPYGTYWIQNMSSYSADSCGGAGWCRGYEDHVWVYDEIPINWVDSSTPHVPVAFRENGPPDGNSDWLDAPVTPASKVQTDNSDRHMIIVDTDEQKVYEFFQMVKGSGNSWTCSGEFVWDLNGYRIQPNDVLHPPYGLASTNAAGVPEIAGIVRYDEVKAGVVTHAVGGVIVQVNYSVSWPGSHKPPENNQAWSRSGEFPDYSQRMRLKENVDISSFGTEAKVVATALKKYGVIIMDRGSIGVSLNVEKDSRFSSLDDLHTLSLRDFEFVDESSLMINASTAKVNASVMYNGQSPVPSAEKQGDFRDSANSRSIR